MLFKLETENLRKEARNLQKKTRFKYLESLDIITKKRLNLSWTEYLKKLNALDGLKYTQKKVVSRGQPNSKR